MNRSYVYWSAPRPPDRDRPAVVIGPEDGMETLCAVNLHQLFTVMKIDLQRRITTLNARRMEEIRQAGIYALNFEEPD